MKNIQDNTLLASLVVFRELYNIDNDVYRTISLFLNEIIKSKSLYNFTLEEITNELNKTYEFDLISTVVKSSLNKLDFIERKNGQYTVVDTAKIKENLVNEKQQEISSINQNIIEELFTFIEENKKQKLSDLDKVKISQSFCCFLLDKSTCEDYLEYITAFIVERKEDITFKEQINLIKEGVIIYTGIKFNNNLNEVGTWKTELTIFMDTEILFHLAGYNGELFQNYVTDFINLVKEINEKARQRLIQLRYFKEVKDEIEGFFTKAKFISDGKDNANPNKTAMLSILKGCQDPSDVIEKKADFYTLLKSYNIEEDNYEKYFDETNKRYNVIDDSISKKVSEEIDADSYPYLNFLNYIAIRRKESNINNFENIRYILLTGNNTTLKVAGHTLIKENGNVPLATNLFFLTNKFWFKLHKGFGKSVLPKSFDTINKAQMVLSGVLNKKIGENYEKLTEEFKKGSISKEQVRSRLVTLRIENKKPEEIDENAVKNILNFITEDGIEKLIEEQSYLKVKITKTEENANRLEKELQIKSERESQLKNANQSFRSELIESKEQTLKEKEHRRNDLENQKELLDKKANLKYRYFKIETIGVVLLFSFLWIFLIFHLGWNVMDRYTYVLGIISAIFSSIYFIIKEEKFPVKRYLKNTKNRIILKAYKSNNFNKNSLDLLCKEIEKINQEIVELKQDNSIDSDLQIKAEIIRI